MSLSTAIQEIRTAIAASPEAASATFRADNDLVGVMEVDVRIGDRILKVDEPASLGGTELGPNPVELTLAALGSCQAITYRVWSEALGIRIDGISVRVDGDLDLRGFFGVDERVRPGFGKVRLAVSLRGPEPTERYEELVRAVDRHCPVLDIFENKVPVETRIELPTAVAAVAGE
jgi:uncharacterized OsmC-like protein